MLELLEKKRMELDDRYERFNPNKIKTDIQKAT